MKELQIGDKAPAFSIAVAEGKNIVLSELKGKFVVLYFYPKDNTPGCTVEARGFNVLLSEFTKLNTEVIGVSKDSLKSHDKFKNLFGLNFHLGSDVECDLCKEYGVWVEKSMFGKKYMGINRVSFLIDQTGKIAHIWPKVSVLNHAQEVLDKVKELS
jgi:thioredoxin-dependent peroxiredoxin